MPNATLTSNLFQNDRALNACLIDDAAHILREARGKHVAKIQMALTLVDNAKIALIELMESHYGPTTTAAVLAYKTKRRIINYSYQTRPDSIVGKITIAALDKELLLRERTARRTHCCVDAVESGRPSASSSAAVHNLGFAVGAPNVSPAPPPKLLPGNPDICWQPSRGAGTAANSALTYLSKALAILKPFRLGIVSSVTAPPDRPFPHDIEVDPDNDDHCWGLRTMAEKVRPGGPNSIQNSRLPVCEKLDRIWNNEIRYPLWSIFSSLHFAQLCQASNRRMHFGARVNSRRRSQARG